MPETAEMPTAEEIAASPAAVSAPIETLTPVKPAVMQAAPLTKQADPKPQVTPVIKPSNAVPAAPLSASEGAKRLVELKSLLDQGVITQQDYDAKKAQILKSM